MLVLTVVGLGLGCLGPARRLRSERAVAHFVGQRHPPVASDLISAVEQAGLFVLPYDAVRDEADPGAAILDFLTSTYDACAARLGWSDELLWTEPAPPGAAVL